MDCVRHPGVVGRFATPHMRSCHAPFPPSIPRENRHKHHRCRSTGGDDHSLREQARFLDKLFYSPTAVPYSSRTLDTVDNVIDETETLRQNQLQNELVLPGLIKDLPLWRVQWAVLPSSQEVLHVHVPHYCDMFNRLFSSPRPWRFGHLYLPGGSQNLGSKEFQLEIGSKAPLVGTLLEVVQCVRFPDGRLLLLAVGLARFKVVRSVQSIPYSRADVIILPDEEEIEHALLTKEKYYTDTLETIDRHSSSSSSSSTTSSSPICLRQALAQHAAVQSAKMWWEYEVGHLRADDANVLIDGEDDDVGALEFGRRLVSIGSKETVELPYWKAHKNVDHSFMVSDKDVEEYVCREIQDFAQCLLTRRTPENGDGGDGGDDVMYRDLEVCINTRYLGMNSVSERGVPVLSHGASSGFENVHEESLEVELNKEDDYDGGIQLCLKLEAEIWRQLDAVRSHAEKISGRASVLNDGMACLRPSTAHAIYPDIRRVQRLSFALASSLGDVSASEGRQAWLEAPSVASRLKLGLGALQRHRAVLAAVLAVRNLSVDNDAEND